MILSDAIESVNERELELEGQSSLEMSHVLNSYAQVPCRFVSHAEGRDSKAGGLG